MTQTTTKNFNLAKQGNSTAIASFLRGYLPVTEIGVRAKVDKSILHILFEYDNLLNQKDLVSLSIKKISELELSFIETVKFYGKKPNTKGFVWKQSLELTENPFVDEFSENNNFQDSLILHNVLEQFLNLKARVDVGINSSDVTRILGDAKLAVDKFLRNPETQNYPYIRALIEKVMLYYEFSIKGDDLQNQGLFIFTLLGVNGIPLNTELGILVRRDFPDLPKSFIHGGYSYSLVINTLCKKAGELTDELYQIVHKQIDLESLKLKKFPINPISDKELLKPRKSKRKIIAGIFAILLGSFGVHKFILGFYKEGLIMLGLYLLFVFFENEPFRLFITLIGIIEGLIYLTMSRSKFDERYVIKKKGWF